MPFKKKEEEFDCKACCDEIKKEVAAVKKDASKVSQIASLKKDLASQKSQVASLKKEIADLNEKIEVLISSSEKKESAKDTRVDELIKRIVKNSNYEKLRLLYKNK